MIHECLGKKTQKELKLSKEEDSRHYLLSTNELGNLVKEQIDLQVTDSQMNEARHRNQLDPCYKNVIRSQDPIEFFSGISQNTRVFTV